MKAFLIPPKFEEYFSDLDKMTGRIDEAALRCMSAAQGIQYAEMKKGLERHKDEGDALKSLVKDPITRNGNVVYTEVGTDGNVDLQGYLHGNYQEYGVKPMYKKVRTFVKKKAYHKGHIEVTKIISNNKPRFIKDPWFRPAIDGTKSKIRTEWKKIIKRITGVDVK